MTGEAPRELATTRALEGLPSGAWRELYEVRFESRHLTNVDHVVVGRTGMFVIDSRDWSGQIEVGPEALVQDGMNREGTLARLTNVATAIAEELPDVDRRHVVPVLCFDHDEPVSAWVGGVLVCTTANLVDLLVEQPRVFGAHQVDDVFNRLTWLLPLATYRVGTPSGPSRAGHRREGRSRPKLVPHKGSHAKHVPSTRSERMTPWVRSALIAIGCYLVMMPAVAYGAWPGVV